MVPCCITDQKLDLPDTSVFLLQTVGAPSLHTGNLHLIMLSKSDYLGMSY